MTFVNFWLDLGDGDGLFYSLDTAWSQSPHFVSLDRANQAAAGGGHGPGHRTHGHNTLLLPAQATILGGCWMCISKRQ